MAGTHALGGHVTAQTLSYTHTAAVAAVIHSIIATIYVPNKATILDVILEVVAVGDTGATLEYDVGDASGPATADDNRFIDQFSGQAIANIRASDSAGLLEGTYTYRGLKGTDDSQLEQGIELTIAAAAATGAIGTGRLTVIYYVG
jgi:hypothetical protein